MYKQQRLLAKPPVPKTGFPCGICSGSTAEKISTTHPHARQESRQEFRDIRNSSQHTKKMQRDQKRKAERQMHAFPLLKLHFFHFWADLAPCLVAHPFPKVRSTEARGSSLPSQDASSFTSWLLCCATGSVHTAWRWTSRWFKRAGNPPAVLL